MVTNLSRSGPVYPVERATWAGELVGLGRAVGHAVPVPATGAAGDRRAAAVVRGGGAARRPGVGPGRRADGAGTGGALGPVGFVSSPATPGRRRAALPVEMPAGILVRIVGVILAAV